MLTSRDGIACSTADEGFWAVQVMERDHSEGQRFLCHAENDRSAVAMATRLSGETRRSIGFNYYSVAADAGVMALPALGDHYGVSDPGVWSRLMAARNGHGPEGRDI
jgi:hypothetical protein